jgi:small subunit ribosomal protein S4
MLRYLELRLDNVVYRAGWGATRPQARQLVSHGHINVNGRRVNIPSFRLRKGDVVELRAKSRDITVVRWNMDVLDRATVPWLDREDDGHRIIVRDLPLREHIDTPVREQMIVELYSK